MKIKPYYLSCLVAGLLGAQACHDKLDVSQKSAITATSMWESEGDALAAVYGAYNKMRSTFSAAYVFWGNIVRVFGDQASPPTQPRSEEHTSELQSRENLVCRLLLEKKKKISNDVF